MRHLFAINPRSGKGKGEGLAELLQSINDACAKAGITPEIYAEANKEGMIDFMRTAAESGDDIRLYACGGDGTVFTAVNATFGHRNVQIAVVPYGSGNDFIKLFGEKEALRDVSKHINGTPHWIDAIKIGDDISVNIVSMGFDAEINAMQAKTKKIPLVGGPAGYYLAMLACLGKKFFSKFTIQIDDDEPMTDEFAFAIGGNSRWYGGGFKPCPNAIPDDGVMECITVQKSLGKLKLITMIGTFQKGDYLEDPAWKSSVTYKRGKVIRIHSDTPAPVNIDGEIRSGCDVTFELMPQSVCFVVPQGSDYLTKRENGTL